MLPADSGPEASGVSPAEEPGKPSEEREAGRSERTGANRPAATSAPGTAPEDGAAKPATPKPGSNASEAKPDHRKERVEAERKGRAAQVPARVGRQDGGGEAGAEAPTTDPENRRDRTPAAPALPPLANLQPFGAVLTGRWTLGLSRDAIVPTLPVLEGNDDGAAASQLKACAAAKDRTPAMLAQPRLTCGVAVKFIRESEARPWVCLTPMPPGARWSVRDGRGEISWAPAHPPRDAFVVLGWDGIPEARIAFDAAGRASVELGAGLRAQFWLAARYPAGESPRETGAPRYSWQVVMGPLAASAWYDDGNWDDGSACRLDLVMNGENPAGTRVVLADRETGWELRTTLR